eukprot:768500-Hanusia_phi.AAC.3
MLSGVVREADPSRTEASGMQGTVGKVTEGSKPVRRHSVLNNLIFKRKRDEEHDKELESMKLLLHAREVTLNVVETARLDGG